MTASGTLFEWSGYAGIPIVYRADNIVNGDFYIGITIKGLRHRQQMHFSSARCGKKGKFNNAIRKYGEEAFIFSVIKECRSYDDALKSEISLIKKLKPSYNLTLGGQGALGYRHSPEVLKRIADQRRGRPGHWRGKKRPDISRMSRNRILANPINYWLGKKRSEATKAKISQTKTGVKYPATDAQTAARRKCILRAIESNKKRVICLYDGRIFDCANAAARYYGLGAGTVNGVLNGKRTSAFGLTFGYEVHS